MAQGAAPQRALGKAAHGGGQTYQTAGPLGQGLRAQPQPWVAVCPSQCLLALQVYVQLRSPLYGCPLPVALLSSFRAPRPFLASQCPLALQVYLQLCGKDLQVWFQHFVAHLQNRHACAPGGYCISRLPCCLNPGTTRAHPSAFLYQPPGLPQAKQVVAL